MDLHCRISFHITNMCFKELIYVEHWHGKVEPNFSNYSEFLKKFDEVFGEREIIREEYPYLFSEEDDEDDEFVDERDEERERLSDSLCYFYPILKTVASGAMENPVYDIIDNIVIPFARE